MSGLPLYNVVTLEGCHCEIPRLDFPHSYKEYDNTTAAQVLERIQHADIVITTIVPVTAVVAAQCPNLKLIAIMATGAGWVDHAYFASRGISVINCPHSNIPAVSQHAIGLYFASRKRIIEMHNKTIHTTEWMDRGTLTKCFPGPPRTCGQEVVGILGHGALGQAIEALCKALGMTVMISERKGAGARTGRVSFEDCLRQSTVLFVCCPKDASTIDSISDAELATMRRDSILINMARGGIVNEAALATALREGVIEAAATDVLEVEPPDGSSPLLNSEDLVPNLTVSPHISWFTGQTIAKLQQLLKVGVETFVAGGLVHAVVDGRRL